MSKFIDIHNGIIISLSDCSDVESMNKIDLAELDNKHILYFKEGNMVMNTNIIRKIKFNEGRNYIVYEIDNGIVSDKNGKTYNDIVKIFDIYETAKLASTTYFDMYMSLYNQKVQLTDDEDDVYSLLDEYGDLRVHIGDKE